MALKMKNKKQKRKREPVECPECRRSIIDLSRHLSDVHGWSKDKARTARQNLGLRKKRMRKDTGRVFNPKICPYDNCGRVVMRLHNHLRDYHKITDQALYKECLDNALDSLDAEGGEVMESDNEDGFNSEEEDVADFRRELRKRHVVEEALEKELVEEDGDDEDDDADWFEAQVRKENYVEGEKLKSKRIRPEKERSRGATEEIDGSDEGLFDVGGHISDVEGVNAGGDDADKDNIEGDHHDDGDADWVKGSDDESMSSFDSNDDSESASDNDRADASGSLADDLLEKLQRWFMSPDGGLKAAKDARQNSRQVGTVLKFVGSLTNLFNKNSLWNDWIQQFSENHRPGTIKSYLISLRHFYTFLISEKVKVNVENSDHNSLVRLKEKLAFWMKSYSKKCEERHWEKEMEDLKKLLTADDYKKFDNCVRVRKAVKLFERLSTSDFRVKHHEFTLLRDYLCSYLCIDNASRTGVIAFLKLSDVDDARKDGPSMTVTVLNNKTLTTKGPAVLSMSLQLYRHLALFRKKVRPQVHSPLRDSIYLFVRFNNGKQIPVSGVTDQFNSMMLKALGGTEVRRRVSATLVRKSCSTKVNATHPELDKDMAVTMNHTMLTKSKHYILVNKRRIAGATTGKMRSIMRDRDIEEREKDTDSNQDAGEVSENENEEVPMPVNEVIGLFNDEEDISMEAIKRKLMSQKLLAYYSPKKICDKLRYLRQKNAFKAVPPTCEESAEERCGRIGLQSSVEKPNTQVDTDEPFTEVGSSITTGRVSFSNAEIATIRRELQDIIQGSCLIRTEEVMERCKNVESLRPMLHRYSERQLVVKVRTERKVFKQKKKGHH